MSGIWESPLVGSCNPPSFDFYKYITTQSPKQKDFHKGRSALNDKALGHKSHGRGYMFSMTVETQSPSGEVLSPSGGTSIKPSEKTLS